jgi:hypothetical protein
MKSAWIIVIFSVFGIMAGFFASKSFLTPEIVTETVVEFDTTFIEKSFNVDSLRATFSGSSSEHYSTALNIDSIRESLWIEAKEYYKKKENDSISTFDRYTATADTSGDETSVHVEFVSPIPIHPDSYFNIKFETICENVTKTIESVSYLDEPFYKESLFLWTIGSILLNFLFLWIIL